MRGRQDGGCCERTSQPEVSTGSDREIQAEKSSRRAERPAGGGSRLTSERALPGRDTGRQLASSSRCAEQGRQVAGVRQELEGGQGPQLRGPRAAMFPAARGSLPGESTSFQESIRRKEGEGRFQVTSCM